MYMNGINKVPIFAVSRLRMGTDGSGITTLVAFMGCPLRCKYCLNEKCHEPIYDKVGKRLRQGVMLLSAQELFDMVKVDNIYFQSTGGGICFGGGEPTLYPEYIQEFRNLCGNAWKITIETCLRCSLSTIKRLSNVVDAWIVDIKSFNSFIYRQYTGEQSDILQHLTSLQINVPNDKITIKVPIIDGFNNEDEVDKEIETMRKQFGFTNIIKSHYITPHKKAKV